MNLRQRIIAFENDFPAAFLDVQRTEFGTMFYDEQNPTSHDSNHAVILNYDNLDRTLAEVKRFYRQKNFVPRIYNSRLGSPERLFPALKNAGFRVTKDRDERFFVLEAPCRIGTEQRLEFRRISAPDPVIVESVYDMDIQTEGEPGKLRALRYFRKFTACPDAHFLVGYLGGIPVTAASIQLSETGVARVDSVETGTAFRRRGFARESIRNLVRYFSEQPNAETLYLYSSNPEAMRIYRDAGFREIAGIDPGWSAEAVEV